MAAVAERTLSSEQLAQFRRDGYIILRGFFSTEETDALRESFMEMNADGPVPGLSEISASYRAEDPLHFYPRMMMPHRHPEMPVGPLAMQRMLDARIGAVLTELFDDEPIAVQSMFYFKPAGARGQELHQDNFYLRVKPGTCMAAWLAVDDADEENGGLMVVPGSDKIDIACPQKADMSRSFTQDYVPVPEGMEVVPARMKAGDMLFFNGSLIHGSYPNVSKDRFRRAFICHYIPAGCAEVSGGYKPCYRFDGTVFEDVEDATGGGLRAVPNINAAF